MFQPQNAVRLHVSLAEIQPENWRRLVDPSDWTLDRLHPILQAAFGWIVSHLHEFRIGGLRYGAGVSIRNGSTLTRSTRICAMPCARTRSAGWIRPKQPTD